MNGRPLHRHVLDLVCFLDNPQAGSVAVLTRAENVSKAVDGQDLVFARLVYALMISRVAGGRALQLAQSELATLYSLPDVRLELKSHIAYYFGVTILQFAARAASGGRTDLRSHSIQKALVALQACVASFEAFDKEVAEEQTTFLARFFGVKREYPSNALHVGLALSLIAECKARLGDYVPGETVVRSTELLKPYRISSERARQRIIWNYDYRQGCNGDSITVPNHCKLMLYEPGSLMTIL